MKLDAEEHFDKTIPKISNNYDIIIKIGINLIGKINSIIIFKNLIENHKF